MDWEVRINDLFALAFVLAVVLYVLYAVSSGIYWVYDEISWFAAPRFRHECVLMSLQYSPSTSRGHLSPTFVGGKVGFTPYSTGRSEKNETVWDCGKYGRLISNDKEVFRWARDTSTLLLAKRGKRARIMGIVHE